MWPGQVEWAACWPWSKVSDRYAWKGDTYSFKAHVDTTFCYKVVNYLDYEIVWYKIHWYTIIKWHFALYALLRWHTRPSSNISKLLCVTILKILIICYTVPFSETPGIYVKCTKIFSVIIRSLLLNVMFHILSHLFTINSTSIYHMVFSWLFIYYTQ